MTAPHRDWLEIASLSQGSLGDFPYPVLLAALAITRRTAVLEMSRKPVEKSITVVEGIPVDCRSNLAHETFGRFLLSSGRLTEEAFTKTLAESLARGVRLGEILVERELLTPEEIFKSLQQNLARRLLDGFTWTSGDFRLTAEAPEAEATVRVRVPQLILTGILKLSALEEVGRGLLPYRIRTLALNPRPPFDEEDLHFKGAGAKVIDGLRSKPRTLDDLSRVTELPASELGRIVYALTLMEVVVPAKRAAAVPPKTAPSPPLAPSLESPSESPPATTSISDEERLLLTSRIFETYLAFRRKDAFDLLQVPEEAEAAEIERAYLEGSKTFAPWELEARGLGDHAGKGRELCLALAKAYAELSEPERRGTLLFRRRLRREEEEIKKKPQFEIKTDLLDSEVQYKKGRKLVEEGQVEKALEFLQFATDCDPQNPIYRAEAAYARYRFQPRDRDESIAEIESALRIDPKSGLARYYLGMIHGKEGDLAEAERHLRRSIKLMAPDRRPIDALRGLTRAGKRKR